MTFMGWMNMGMAAVGVSAVCFGAWMLATGKLTPRLAEQYTRSADAARYFLGFGLFFLLQVAGYVGVQADLFGNLARGALMMLAFIVAAFTMLRYRPGRTRT